MTSTIERTGRQHQIMHALSEGAQLTAGVALCLVAAPVLLATQVRDTWRNSEFKRPAGAANAVPRTVGERVSVVASEGASDAKDLMLGAAGIALSAPAAIAMQVWSSARAAIFTKR